MSCRFLSTTSLNYAFYADIGQSLTIRHLCRVLSKVPEDRMRLVASSFYALDLLSPKSALEALVIYLATKFAKSKVSAWSAYFRFFDKSGKLVKSRMKEAEKIILYSSTDDHACSVGYSQSELISIGNILYIAYCYKETNVDIYMKAACNTNVRGFTK
jgi:hypothetical protein